ncbi:MAG: SDR family oxidoreductase [Oscillospiraceae bacterium]|nr:SDR family oxidoreductase [Oscillospiraceae bacterium]
MFELNGKVAVVTGGAAGIGRGLVKCLAAQGADVAICDLPGVNAEDAIKDAAAYGVRVIFVEMDVANEEMVISGMKKIEEVFGKVDILCCNAGINTCENTATISCDSWDRHFDINVRGGLLPMRQVIEGMKERGFGRIIFTASQASIVGRPNSAAYCATKGAVVALARGLALDYAQYGITVNCVAPTFVLTDISRKRMEDPNFREFVNNMIPMHRLATPEEVGSAVAFLASEEASMTTGSVLMVDGGWTVQ